MQCAALDSSRSCRAWGDVLVLDCRLGSREAPGLHPAKHVSPACCNLDSSLGKPDFAAPLSGGKPAGDWNTTKQTLPRTLWAPLAVCRMGWAALVGAGWGMDSSEWGLEGWQHNHTDTEGTAFISSIVLHILFSEGVYGVQGASSLSEDSGRYKGLLNALC